MQEKTIDYSLRSAIAKAELVTKEQVFEALKTIQTEIALLKVDVTSLKLTQLRMLEDLHRFRDDGTAF